MARKKLTPPDQSTPPDFSKFSGKDGQPTKAERRLIEACAKGHPAICLDLPEEQRVVSAELMVSLGVGKFHHKDWPNWPLHDRGLWLIGAIVRERLDASERSFPSSLIFERCRFEKAVRFADSRIDGRLVLDGCTLTGMSDFSDAEISGQFSASVVDGQRAEFSNPDGKEGFGKAIFAQGVRAADWFMQGARVEGAFDINSAEISGQFNANAVDGQRAEFSNPDGEGGFGLAIVAQGVKAADWFMDGARVEGAFNIAGAEISGQFNANAIGGQRAEFSNPDGKEGFGKAIFAQGVKAADWFMQGARVEGAFEINSAEISGQFSASVVDGQRAEFSNPDGEGGFGLAIVAHGVKAAGWFMQGARVEGAFNIAGAEISGQFGAGAVDGQRAEFSNPDGDAICFDYARIKGGIWLAESNGTGGASIDGRLHCHHAIIGTRLQLAGVSLDCGTSGNKAVSLVMARIEGRLVMPNHAVRGIIDLSRAHCEVLEDVAKGWPKPLDRGCTHCGRETLKRKDGTDTGIDIQHLVLDGFTYDHLEFANGKSENTTIAQARIDWLSAQSAKALKHEFDPQPWRQCARVLREMGHDEAAQKISIARRERERRSDDLTKNPSEWQKLKRKGLIFSDWFLHKFADYGYSPWKGIRWSAGLVLLCGAIYGLAAYGCGPLHSWEAAKGNACGGQPAFVQTRFNDFEEVAQGDVKTRPGYPEFRPFAYSLDLFVPLLDLGSEGYWRANTAAGIPWGFTKHPFLEISIGKHRFVLAPEFPIGWLLYVLSVLQVLAGSILIAITITGFTGLLTRDDMK